MLLPGQCSLGRAQDHQHTLVQPESRPVSSAVEVTSKGTPAGEEEDEGGRKGRRMMEYWQVMKDRSGKGSEGGKEKGKNERRT